MIESTFSIFHGIGPRIERYLWRIGIFTWHDFLARERVPGISPARKSLLDEEVASALSEWKSGNLHYFDRLLGPGGMWRVWGQFAGRAVCMDIETDGRRVTEGIPTVVGFYSRGEYRCYVAGKDLTEEAVQQEIDGARLLVTFSGATFDIPYLKAFYPRLDISLPHLDLCPAGHRAGLKGGLKKVEQLIGISRADEVCGMDGYQAVLLWQAYLKGSREALDTLIQYNREDTVNLHAIAGLIYGRLKDESELPALLAERPSMTACP